MAHTYSRTRRHLIAGTVGAAAIALLLTACGDDEPSPNETGSPEPTLTAPPTQTPEDEARTEIEATYNQLITKIDAYYQNASDFGGQPGWNAELVGTWPLLRDAELEVTNWVGYFHESGTEQVGDTVTTSHEIDALQLSDGNAGTASTATSIACQDMSGVTYETYDGQSADLPIPPPQFQVWTMTWIFQPEAAPESGVETPGWYIDTIEVAVDEPC